MFEVIFHPVFETLLVTSHMAEGHCHGLLCSFLEAIRSIETDAAFTEHSIIMYVYRFQSYSVCNWQIGVHVGVRIHFT